MMNFKVNYGILIIAVKNYNYDYSQTVDKVNGLFFLVIMMYNEYAR